MKLLVPGHLAVDCVHSGADGAGESFGGIAHAIAALGRLAGKGDTILPVCGVGAADAENFQSWLGRIPSVDPSGVYALEVPTHRIDLYPRPDGTRVACAKDIAPPVAWERIRKFLPADGILINMASGCDITLETLDQIRLEVRGRGTPVHLDYHNLTTGVGPERERFRRPLPEWRRWAFMLHSVQMNEEEAAGLTVERLSEDQLIGHLLTLGTGCVLITRGARGATLCVSEHKKIVRHDFPGVQAPPAPGAGDVFGAAFLFRSVASQDPVAAAAFAAQAAGEFLSVHRGR